MQTNLRSALSLWLRVLRMIHEKEEESPDFKVEGSVVVPISFDLLRGWNREVCSPGN